VRILLVASLLLIAPAQRAPQWTIQPGGTSARLRGVSAVSERVVWASGSNGTVVRTTDGGQSWKQLHVPDSATLDFRDVDAVDERTAFVLSIGNGPASRIYKTTDGGVTWTLQFTNDDPKAFFDAMAFRDRVRGYAFSDSVDGRFVVLETTDGATWARIAPDRLPPALDGEGAYAASGSNVALHAERVWIGTTASRVLQSADAGRTWTVATTALPTGPSAGIFSIAFRDRMNGIVVGGDYKKEAEAVDNAALTADGGRTWTLVKGLSGFRSAVAYVPGLRRTIVATGPSGTDYSTDDGRTWKVIPGPGFHALSFAPGSRSAWGVGERGAIWRLDM
jgi:photosystem II stability/assembly factor-like uncharacterized protein